MYLSRIGILGGSFDPVHSAHISIAKAALETMELEKVFFVPVAHSPFKENPPVASSYHRIRMLELALSDFNNFDYLDWEINRGKISYSYQTALELKENWPNAKIFWIIGSDMIESLPRWLYIDKLANLIEFIVLDRADHEYIEPSDIINLKIHKVNSQNLSISSTEIRKLITEGKPVQDCLPESVYNYIKINNLYSNG